MDPTGGNRTGLGATIPPLGSVTNLGTLQYVEGGQVTPVKPDIHGTIDKGFFLSEGDWTCYRRNYFSCVCSYSLSPPYPTAAIQFTQNGSQQTFDVIGFAMSISAVVADNDGHAIELVQHTPKRDKGPIAKPEKVRLAPRHPQSPHHPLGLFGGHDNGMSVTSRAYDAYPVQPPGTGNYQTEHTFERIQFKQATANNGKRRAAQQYYHLLVELWAEVGNQTPDQFVKVAYRKSAKMIVRGRSPGHYQTERRGSTSSGPGGGGGSVSGYSGPMMGTDFGSGGPMLGSPYSTGYETRGGNPYGGGRHHHHDIPPETAMPAKDADVLMNAPGYIYYPYSTYDGQQDSRQGVAMFNNRRNEHETGASSHVTTSVEQPISKIKTEYDGSIPPIVFHNGRMMANRSCGPFEGKPRSEGYYPTLLPQSGMSITNIT
jgi:meiosis-specific transcription factor NDT80